MTNPSSDVLERLRVAQLHAAPSDRRVMQDACVAIAERDATIERLSAELERKTEALRNIAEGNLGDAAWQANYDRIREVARASLTLPPTNNERSQSV